MLPQLEALNQTVAKWSANLGRGIIAMSKEEAREEEDRIVAELEEIEDNPLDDEQGSDD